MERNPNPAEGGLAISVDGPVILQTQLNECSFQLRFRRFFTSSETLLNYCTQRASKELRANAGNQVK